jgi:BirA family transcriptional regulator, biotin operon repressor / biotin---[acetyl-CoA-carboxylase] ligase
MLFAALSRTMLWRLAQWDLGRGFGLIRAAWLKRATGLGEAIRVSLPERDVQGRFESLDSTGRLLLRHEDGRLEAITAADIFPLDARASRSAGERTA